MNFLLWLTDIYITILPSGLSHNFLLCSSSSWPALSKYYLNFYRKQRPLNRSQGPHLVSWLSLGLTCGQPQPLTEVPKAVAWLLRGKFSSTCSNSQLPDTWEATACEVEPSENSHLPGLHLPQPFEPDGGIWIWINCPINLLELCDEVMVHFFSSTLTEPYGQSYLEKYLFNCKVSILFWIKEERKKEKEEWEGGDLGPLVSVLKTALVLRHGHGDLFWWQHVH